MSALGHHAPGATAAPGLGRPQRVYWYSDRPLPRAPGRWPGAVCGALVVIIDGPGGLPARRLVWLIGYGPPHRCVGMYDRRLARRLRDMLLATLRMAGFQPRVSHQLLGLVLRSPRWAPRHMPHQVRSRGRGRRGGEDSSAHGHLRHKCPAPGEGGGSGRGPSPMTRRPYAAQLVVTGGLRAHTRETASPFPWGGG